MPGFTKCVKSSGVDINTLHDKPASLEVLCFSKCMADEKGVLNGDGTFDVENLFGPEEIKGMKPELVPKIGPMKECVKAIVVKECEGMQKFIDCADTHLGV
nr:unnamed protein product [Callosobruchus analis]